MEIEAGSDPMTHGSGLSTDAPDDSVFVTTVYGRSYLPFLATHLFSVSRYHPRSTEMVLWQDLPSQEIDILSTAFPQTRFAEFSTPLFGDRVERVSRKLHVWKIACLMYPDTPLCFIDVDTVLVRSLDRYLCSEADLLFTWKDELLPVNAGVIIIRKGRLGAVFMDAWITRMERILAAPEMRRQAIRHSGAADQHAFRELVGFVNYDRLFERSVSGTTMRFQGVECRLLNETQAVALTEETHVLHYKGIWHSVLLDRAPIPPDRPEIRLYAMHDHWLGLKAEAGAEIAGTLVRRSALEKERTFAPLVKNFEERGILYSEMLAVCSVCDRLGVDVIIESGRCRGQSTRVIAGYFAEKPITFISIDLRRDADAAFAEEELRPYTSVHLMYGDSRKIIPRLVRKFAGKKIALLIDGPKGMAAVDLFLEANCLSESIVAGFIHDLKPGSEERKRLAEVFSRIWYSQDPEYVENFRHLDHPCLPASNDPITMHTWRPFRKGEQVIDTYGPTIAVVLPLSGDVRREPPRFERTVNEVRTRIRTELRRASRILR